MDLRVWKIFSDLDPVFLSNIKLALTVGLNDFLGKQMGAIMVTHDDNVFSLGATAGADGILGVEGLENTVIPARIRELCGKQVKKLAGGYGHVIALTESGQLYGWGDNRFRQLGLGNERGVQTCETTIYVPQLIKGALHGKRVLEVACGFNHTLAVTSEGEVYGWGYNKHGRVGVGSQDYVIDAPTKVVFSKEDVKIRSVACGRHFSAALSDEGKVYLWGSNEFSQLGFASDYPPAAAMSAAPRELILPCKFTSIVCGPWHTLALTDKNECYCLGHCGNMLRCTSPRQIASTLGHVLEVAATFQVPLSALKTSSGIYIVGETLEKVHGEPHLTHCQTTDEAFARFPIYSVMWRPLYFAKHGPTVRDSWLAALQDKRNCDLEFEVDGRSIPVHRLFLEIRSEHFRRWLAGPWADNRVLQVTEFHLQDFLAFIRYLYTDLIEPDGLNQVFELLKMADYYGEADLHERCQHLLKISTNVSNVCQMYTFSCQYNAKKLEKYTAAFINENYSLLMQNKESQSLEYDIALSIVKDVIEDDLDSSL